MLRPSRLIKEELEKAQKYYETNDMQARKHIVEGLNDETDLQPRDRITGYEIMAINPMDEQRKVAAIYCPCNYGLMEFKGKDCKGLGEAENCLRCWNKALTTLYEYKGDNRFEAVK